MVVTATEIVSTLRALGFYDFLLPWVFAFAVVYGLLMTVKLFEEKVNKKISGALALVAAFFVTAFAGRALTSFFVMLFGNATIVLAGILIIVLLVAMVGYDVKDKVKKNNAALIVLIIIGVLLFIISTGAASGIGYWALLSPDIIALVIVMIIIIAAVYMIVKEDEPAAAAGAGKKEV